MGIFDKTPQGAVQRAYLNDAFGALRSDGGGPRQAPMAMQYIKQKQEQEKLQQALAQAKQGGLPMGMNPQAFEALSSVDPRQALAMLTQPPTSAKPPASVQEYNFARAQGFQGTFHDWITAKAEASSTRINNSINTGDSDAFKYGTIEPGYRVNRATGVAEPVPGSSAARKAQTADATVTKGREDKVNTAQQMIDSIDAILTDEALPYATGVFAPLQNIPGTGAYRFGTKSRQLQGQAFLQAIETLKGTGQITEVEGQKATEAIGRLDPGMSEEDYKASLNELKAFLEEVQGRAITGGVSPRANPTFNSVPLQSMSDDDLDAQIRRLQGQ